MTHLLGRRAISLVLIVLMAMGCARTVEVPRQQYEEASHLPLTVHAIRMTDGTKYSVREFSVVDSALVVRSLNKTDPRYEKAIMPIVLRLDEVESVESLDPRRTLVFVGLGVLALVGAAYWIFSAGLSSD